MGYSLPRSARTILMQARFPDVAMSDTRMFLISALSSALLGAACGTEGTAPVAPEAAQATQLVKSGGDQQAWYFDNSLPTPYAVTARDETTIRCLGWS